jgi:oligopeptide/dipeptide ABC transporter ATP-binding protein
MACQTSSKSDSKSAEGVIQLAKPVLEVERLRTEFHLRSATVTAVDGVSFAIHEGECLGLVGESGCGKSTTGLSIMRLLPRAGHITAGNVLLGSRDLVSLSRREMRHVRGREVSMIFQDPMTSLNPTLTIGAQVAEPVRIHLGASKAAAATRVLEVLHLVGFPNPRERLDDFPHQLSGGLRQRVMIAIALAAQPKLLIADEPTTALDVTIQAQILDLLDRLREELAMAVLLITHDMGVIAGRTDRVMMMYAGKSVEGAPTNELFASMRHPYAEALLQSIPRLNQAASARLYSIPGHPPDLSEHMVGCRFAPRCRYAADRCRTEEPALAPANSSHPVACFYPVSDGTSETSRLTAAPPEAASRGADAPSREDLLRTAPVLIEVDHIVKEYPARHGVFARQTDTVKAVSDVSFTIRHGETFGLVGESGCGKSTLGRLLAALEHPTAGSVRLNGDELLKLTNRNLQRRRRELQFVFQDPSAALNPRMRAGTIMREPLIVQGVGNRREQWETVATLLEEVGLSAKAAGLYPHEFSGGQRQRVGLARALTLSPRFIVADEPTSALDVSIQSQVLNLMKALQQRHGLTYLVISHDLALLRYISDTIGVMYLGKLVELGPSRRIYETPAHPYSRGLIDAIPVPDPAVERAKAGPSIRGELPSAIAPPSGCRFRTRCPLATDLCAEEEPPLRVFGPGHVAACHFPLQPLTEDEPPAGVTVADTASGRAAAAT